MKVGKDAGTVTLHGGDYRALCPPFSYDYVRWWAKVLRNARGESARVARSFAHLLRLQRGKP
jgi:hypothetical protein